MKFACPKCHTRYSIADDKVPPAKTLRFPCKRCDNVIRIRRKKGKSEPTAPAPARSDPSSTRVASLGEIDQLRQQASNDRAEADTVAVSMAALGEAPAPDGSGSGGPLSVNNTATKVANLNELAKLRSEAGLERTAPKRNTGNETKVASVEEIRQALDAGQEGSVGIDGFEWYVLIGGKQQGPMGTPSVQSLLERHEIDRRTYVWRDGLEDWKRLGAVDEFANDAALAGDAAWRVMAPVRDPTPVPVEMDHQATAAMDVRQLQEQLAQAREPASADLPTNPEGQATAANDPALIDALVGEPTGDKLSRSMTEETTGVIESAELLDPTAEAFAVEPDPFANDGPATVPPTDDAPHDFSSESDLFAAADNAAAADFNEPNLTDELRPPAGLGPSLSEAEPLLEDTAPPNLSPDVEASDTYFNAPPGESTRVFMATAGLYRRRRKHRIAAVTAILVSIFLVGVVSLDILGLVEIPGMGMFFQLTGLQDPNAERAVELVEQKLNKTDLSPEKRAELQALRRKLMGTAPKRGGHGKAGKGRRSGATAGITEGVRDTQEMTNAQRDFTADVFGDDRKQETKIKLADPKTIKAPNLPSGLTQEAISSVVVNNSTSMNLCLAEASRKGEQLAGKMEIELTIAADGSVTDVRIPSPKFKNTVMATCAAKRIKGWRFPAFNGQPVTVVYPYVLQMGF